MGILKKEVKAEKNYSKSFLQKQKPITGEEYGKEKGSSGLNLFGETEKEFSCKNV